MILATAINGFFYVSPLQVIYFFRISFYFHFYIRLCITRLT